MIIAAHIPHIAYRTSAMVMRVRDSFCDAVSVSYTSGVDVRKGSFGSLLINFDTEGERSLEVRIYADDARLRLDFGAYAAEVAFHMAAEPCHEAIDRAFDRATDWLMEKLEARFENDL